LGISNRDRVLPPFSVRLHPLWLVEDDNMFRSVAAAEKAALEGEGQDYDTQQCLDLQNELLSVRICTQPRREAYWDHS
jgi:hypothetical protein